MQILRAASHRWVSPEVASRELGFSENSLKCWRDAGYLREGKHWQLKFPLKSSQICYQVEECKKEMDEWWGRKASDIT